MNRDGLVDFVYHEASLLDEGRFDEWLDLFAPHGRYWMPLEPGQTDPLLVTSLLYEETSSCSGSGWSASRARARSRRSRRAAAITCCSAADRGVRARGGPVVTATAFHYVETRLDEQELYAGLGPSRARDRGRAFRIAPQRVDLVNCDAAFGNIQLFP